MIQRVQLSTDHGILQDYLNLFASWFSNWLHRYFPDKCKVDMLHILEVSLSNILYLTITSSSCLSNRTNWRCFLLQTLFELQVSEK